MGSEKGNSVLARVGGRGTMCPLGFWSTKKPGSDRFPDVVWGPVVQSLVQRFRSERLRVQSRQSATFTPSAHVRTKKKAVFAHACLATDVN